MKRKNILDSLLNLTTSSFNSLGYADWSTSVESIPKAVLIAKKAVIKNENKVKN